MDATVSAREAIDGLSRLRRIGRHRFLTDDVSPTASDFPPVRGHQQVTDAHLLTLARRHAMRLVTFDRGLAALGGGDVLLLDA